MLCIPGTPTPTSCNPTLQHLPRVSVALLRVINGDACKSLAV